MEHLGINIERMSSGDKDDTEYLDIWMRSNGVKIENRVYETTIDDPTIRVMEEDWWRGGIYVYKNNEIVGFIGSPSWINGHFNILTTDRVK